MLAIARNRGSTPTSSTTSVQAAGAEVRLLPVTRLEACSDAVQSSNSVLTTEPPRPSKVISGEGLRTGGRSAIKSAASGRRMGAAR